MSSSLININRNSVGKTEIAEKTFEDFNFKGLLFLEGKEYMLMASLFADKKSDNHAMTPNCLYDASFINSNFEKTANASIPHLMYDLLLPSEKHCVSEYEHLNRACSMIKIYAEHHPTMLLGESKRKYRRTSYDAISSSFFNSDIETYYLQSMKKLQSGKGLLYHEEEENLLMAIVFKTSLLKYQKLHFLTKGVFDWSIVEFWILKDIDTPKYPNKGLRKMYRSKIKTKIEKFNIPIVEKASLNKELAALFEIPQNSLEELEKWKKEIVVNTLHKEQKNMKFSFIK
jgi:hypothetical protein